MKQKFLFFLGIVCFFSLTCEGTVFSGTLTTISAPITVASPTNSNAAPQVAVALNGNAFAIWINFPNNIQTAFFDYSTQNWAFFNTLAQGSSPKIAIDAFGNTTIVFVSPTNQIITTRYNTATITFSPFTEISIPGTINIAPQVSVNSFGTAVVVWIQNTPFQVLAADFNPLTELWSLPAIFLNNTYPASFMLDNFATGIAILNTFPNANIQAATILVVP